jgi:DNA mismatch repair protein MSH4
MTSLNAIDARLSAVSELIQGGDIFNAIRDALKGVQKVDLDKLIIRLATLDRRREAIENSVKTAYDRMGQLLDLQKIIRNIPAVGRATAGCTCTLLRVIGEVRALLLRQLGVIYRYHLV